MRYSSSSGSCCPACVHRSKNNLWNKTAGALTQHGCNSACSTGATARSTQHGCNSACSSSSGSCCLRPSSRNQCAGAGDADVVCLNIWGTSGLRVNVRPACTVGTAPSPPPGRQGTLARDGRDATERAAGVSAGCLCKLCTSHSVSRSRHRSLDRGHWLAPAVMISNTDSLECMRVCLTNRGVWAWLPSPASFSK